MDAFEIHHIHNYTKIYDSSVSHDIIALLARCDFFIYQPLSNKYPVYNTDNLKTYLKDGCKTISFPYIYNDALTPVAKILRRDLPKNGEYDDNGNNVAYVNSEPIVLLKKQGKTMQDIRVLYYNNQIDFKYDERFNKSIELLKKNELYTDVKVSDYIIKNFKSKILFNSNLESSNIFVLNHPSNILLLEYANQIINMMGYSSVEYTGSEILNGTKCVSLSEIHHFGYEYVNSPTQNYDNIIFNIITEIYNLP